ncbi:hypothetical protein MPSEU_000196400 [Mayamaea pseudoterrestris]|nr:hypothetical protein MPSEU_000196400 [Mayamaea pseudoterrestris]
MTAILWAAVLCCLLIQFTLLHKNRRSMRGESRHLLHLHPTVSTDRRHMPFHQSARDEQIRVVFSNQESRVNETNTRKYLRRPPPLRQPIVQGGGETGNNASDHSTFNDIPNDSSPAFIPNILYSINLQRDDNEAIIVKSRFADRGLSMFNEALQVDSKHPQTAELHNVLNETDCLRIIHEAEPRLDSYYTLLTDNAGKAALCRLAALYATGGYAVDPDAPPMQVPNGSSLHNCTFVAIRNYNLQDFSSSMFAATARHEIMRLALDLLVNEYDDSTERVRGDNSTINLSPNQAIYNAYHSLGARYSQCLLQETDVNDAAVRDKL